MYRNDGSLVVRPRPTVHGEGHPHPLQHDRWIFGQFRRSTRSGGAVQVQVAKGGGQGAQVDGKVCPMNPYVHI